MAAPLRVGVVGLGAISRFYLRALRERPSVRLAAVCDPSPEALAPFAGTVPCHRDHRDLIAAGGLDAVVVAAPNHLHAGIAGDAVAAGLAVCVEKPLATDLADARTLAAAAERNGVPLLTAFHRRYNTAVAALAGRLAGRAPVTGLTVRYLERIEDHIGGDAWYLDPARCGGGCVADNGPNAFDLVRLLLGEVEVADARIARDPAGLDRRAGVRLTAAGGAEAVVELDWAYRGELKDVRVRLADGGTDSADMLAGHPGFKDSLWHEYAAIVADFEDRVRGRAPTARDGGVAALALVEAAYRAERPAPSGAPDGVSAGAEGRA
ncbi:Gfo/Idh/MocA family oxidoreductase [Streptomonospora sp. S1-112]|uniref:Gfo/Idh/MocA family oxidoreductase n=1 Tax=Streptomonospora mangrovi TaxID=2883123 RepID=A0A9X3P0W2_9ACTN|nr:Gfo/Idh/MocA family oxidoreductase [Streptomonospora mangrovi]MDA0567831.1 Gfo/Idh/MocA family oxidoreductase [Streptomonospora mangrovi]